MALLLTSYLRDAFKLIAIKLVKFILCAACMSSMMVFFTVVALRVFYSSALQKKIACEPCMRFIMDLVVNIREDNYFTNSFIE